MAQELVIGHCMSCSGVASVDELKTVKARRPTYDKKKKVVYDYYPIDICPVCYEALGHGKVLRIDVG